MKGKAAKRLVPGRGIAWADYLDARARLILEWRAEGQSFEEIAQQLCCDPVQARLIHMTFAPTSPYPNKPRSKKAKR